MERSREKYRQRRRLSDWRTSQQRAAIEWIFGSTNSFFKAWSASKIIFFLIESSSPRCVLDVYLVLFCLYDSPYHETFRAIHEIFRFLIFRAVKISRNFQDIFIFVTFLAERWRRGKKRDVINVAIFDVLTHRDRARASVAAAAARRR